MQLTLLIPVQVLRASLNNVGFDLDDKVGEAEEQQNTWIQTIIPED